MRRTVLIALLMLSSFTGFGQEWEQIKDDDRFIWGEGWGHSVEEADRQALASLTSKISIAISGDFRQVEEQVDGPSGTSYVSIKSNRLAMTSNATLFNTNRVVLNTGRKSHVGRWICRSELETVFSDRKDRVLEFEDQAQAAEIDGRIDDALKYHYWAYVLLRSIQRPSELRDEKGRMLLNTIPEQMNAIFDALSVSAAKRGNSLVITFSFKGRPIQGLDFRYFDGAHWSEPRSVSRGTAMVEMAPGALAEVVQVRIEYAYTGDAMMDPELAEILSAADVKPLKKALKIFRRT